MLTGVTSCRAVESLHGFAILVIDHIAHFLSFYIKLIWRAVSLDRLVYVLGITQNDLAEARTSQETKFFNEVRQLLEHGGNPNFQLLDNDATLVSDLN